MNLYKYHSDPSKLLGSKILDVDYLKLGVVDGSTYWITSSKYDKELSYDDAVRYCENLIVGEFNDWVLPSIHDLADIYQLSKKVNLSSFLTNDSGFDFVDGEYYRSSTVEGDQGRLFGMLRGTVALDKLNVSYFVRPVRKL